MFAITASIETILVRFGTGLGGLLAIVASLTLGRSLLSVRPRRYERRRYPELYAEVYGRSVRPDSEWGPFVDSLSKRDRSIVRDVLDSLLRTLRGRERRELQAAARELNIHEKARKRLKSGSPRDRRRALVWLVLLEEPLPPVLLHRYCRDDDALAGGARLLYVCGHPDARREGTQLLFGDSDQTLTAFGEDTLYQLHRGEGTRLVRQSGREHGEWRPTFLIQVLTVIGHLTPAYRGVSLSWISKLTESPYREVRAAVALALSPYGHHEEVRNGGAIDRLCFDSEPDVRKAAYETLAAWGDDAALSRLEAATIAESDARVRVAAVRLFAASGSLDRLAAATSERELEEAIAWVRAERTALEGGAPA